MKKKKKKMFDCEWTEKAEIKTEKKYLTVGQTRMAIF